MRCVTSRRADAPAGEKGGAQAEYDGYNFTTEDGLPSNEGNGGVSYVDSQGRIWFGSVGGVAVYDPAQEVPNHAADVLKAAAA